MSLQTKIEMVQRREDKCSLFSLEGLNIGRKGELKFLVISTDTEVFIFDIEYFGVNAFKWGLYSVLGKLIFIHTVYLLYGHETETYDI